MDNLDRVLDTRLSSMGHVLGRLKKLSEEVSAARKGLDDLSTQIYELGAPFKRVTTTANKLKSDLQQMTVDTQTLETTGNENFRITAADLTAVSAKADTLAADLMDLSNRVLFKASESISRLRRWSVLSKGVLKVEIDDDTTLGLENALRDAPTKPDPWGYYLAEVQDACDRLFDEYVDLLGGIALRDQGLDQVSRHADVLVPLLLGSFGAEGALAVPSRHTGGPLVQSKHVRLPLPPGWTLWSLPLVARGVGELFRASKLPGVARADLVPDIFGTFVLGPSYVFAALLLELDPRLPEDQDRAEAMFRVLERTDADDDNGRFTRLKTEIRDEWAKATASALSVLSDSADPTLRRDIDSGYDQVKQRCDNAAYLSRDHWDDVETLGSALRGAAAVLEVTGDLRDVLNAMWLARWRDPAKIIIIEARATSAAEQVAVSGGGPGGSRGGSQAQENKK